MKILVIGAGVLGCNLAANLFEAGKDVTLLARGEWYATLRKKGLMIKHCLFPRTIRHKITVIHELKSEDTYDIIFVCAQFTQLDEIADILMENLSKQIVFVGNNLKPREFAERLKGKQVMFGFTLAAGHRESDRVVSIDLKMITIGDLKGQLSHRRLISETFRGTKYRVFYEPDMESYLVCHAAIVLPICYACYCVGGDLKKLAKNPVMIHRIIRANIELYRVMRKLGYQLLPEVIRQYRTVGYRYGSFWFYKFMAATSLGKLCASDHAMSAIPEMSELSRNMEEMIKRSGQNTSNYHKLQKMQQYI